MPMKRICFCLACTLFLLSGCAESQNETQAVQQGEQAAMNEGQIEEEEQMEEKMIVEIGSTSFTATLAENEAAQAFAAHLQDEPLTVSMSDYAGFEKVGALGFSLPADDAQTTTQSGDIVLYQGNQIVVFYGTNSWSYTKLGKIDDLRGWQDALGKDEVNITFSLAE